MQVLIKEKQTELERFVNREIQKSLFIASLMDRYNLQHESLSKVLEEQQALMEKLSNNET